MCLAIPARVMELGGTTAVVSVEGALSEVNISLVPAAQIGTWVLVHAGFAIAVIGEGEAEETYSLLREAGDILPPPEGGAIAGPEEAG